MSFLSSIKSFVGYITSTDQNRIEEVIDDIKLKIETTATKVVQKIIPFVQKNKDLYLSPRITFDDTFEDKFVNKSQLFDVTEISYKQLNEKKMGIGFINGVNTTLDAAKGIAGYLSELTGGYNIKGVYNATHGWHNDLKESYKGLNFTATRPVRLLHVTWNKFFTEADNDATFLQICHSQGVIHTRNALISFDPEKRKRIFVIGIGPAGYIFPENCRRVLHYRAPLRSDPIPYLDGLGEKIAKDTIYTLKPHKKSDKFDHQITSSTYQPVLISNLKTYLDSGGKEL